MMNKKLLICLVSLTCLVCIIVGGVYAASGNNESKTSNEIYYQWGQILNTDSHSNEEQNTIAIRARDFSVSTEKWNEVVSTFELTGYNKEEAIKQAKTLLTEKYTMYHEAIKNGFQATREEAVAVIEATKNGVAVAENRSDFDAFLAGIQMTSDEYWESQVENRMIYLTIGKYKDSLKETFQSTNLMTNSTDENQEQWEQYYQGIVDNAVAAQEIVYTTE